jgi:RHS repeat-associated protein
VSAAGVTSTSSFDGLGHVVHEASAGTWSSHAYDGLGDEITTTTPAPNTTTPPSTTTTATTSRVFNPNGTVHTQTTTAAGTTTYLYDSIGRQIGAVDAAGLTVSSTSYDALGHVTSAKTINTVTPLTGGGAATTVQTIVDTAYDPDGRVASVTLPYVSGATKTTNTTTYDPLGRVTQTTVNYISGSSDPAANLITKNYYDAAGHLIASLDPKNIATRWVYSVGGQLAMTINNCTASGGNDGTSPPANPAICAGSGTSDGSTNLRSQSKTVSGSGEISTTQTSGTAPATVTTTTIYDGKGRVLKTVVDPDGLNLETDYAYDSAGRLFAQASPTPDGAGKVVKIIMFFATGQVQKTIDNCTDTGTDATWSACTGTAGEDGTHNLTTTYSYDTAGHVASQKSPSHAVTSYTYDGAGRVTTTTTNNATTAYYYDAAGRKIAVATPNELLSSDGKTKSYTVTRFAYDAAGNMVGQLVNCTDSGTTAPVGDAAIASCSGKSGSTWNSSTNVLTTYKYDAQGHVISMIGPSPVDSGASTARVTTDYAYDANGRTCRVIENAQSPVDPTTLTCTSSVTSTTTTNVSTTYTYDKAGNLASSTQGADPVSGSSTATTSYLYDGARHLISQTDGLGHKTTWTYDTLGRKATETDPDTTGGSTVAWFYDPAGRMCRRVAAATGNHLPDVSGLTGPCTDPIAAVAIDTRYAYDSAGNATGAKDAKTGQVVSATYDAVHRPTAVTNTGGAIGTSDPGTTYAYRSLTTVGRTDPSGTYTFKLDAYGRETAMSNPIGSTGSDSYTWTYGPSGALIGQTEPLGTAGTTDLTITNAYDAIGRLTAKTTATLTATATGSTIDSQSYTYNAAGAELSGADTLTGNPMKANGTSTYGYDALGRLTSAKVPTQSNQAYTWNATADRATVQSGTSQAVTTYYNGASQPASDSTGGTYSSDKEGRLTGQPGQSLKWDNLGRLTEVDGSGGSVTTYSYDPLDRLAAVVNGGVTTKYFYVGLTATIAKTIISTGSTTSSTSHLTDAAGTELAQVTGTSGPVYLGRNGHGDVTSTVNAAGSVVSAAQYDPFGKLTSSSGTLPANRWQGSLFEPNSGLYYVIARWYSPGLGRFLSVDPLAGNAARPQSLDRYAYVAGNPLGGVDPMGTCNFDTVTMTCKDSNGVDQSSFQRQLAAATAPPPFNKCLATNFHADGCTSTSAAWVETVSSTVCTQTNNYASSCTVYHSASIDLINATNQIIAEVQLDKERAQAETDRYNARQAFAAAEKAKADALQAAQDAIAAKALKDAKDAEDAKNCSLNPFDGNSCAGRAVGAAANAARSGVQWVQDNKATIIFAVTMTACIGVAIADMGASSVACAAYAIAGGAGLAGYTGSTVAGNVAAGKGWLDGYDINQGSLAGMASGATAAVCTFTAGLGCAAAGAATSAAQYGLATGRNPVDDPFGYAFAAASGATLAKVGGSSFKNKDFWTAPTVNGFRQSGWNQLGLEAPSAMAIGAGLAKGAATTPVVDGMGNALQALRCSFGIGQC